MSRVKLLIVDDSENIRDVLQTNFDYLGYDVRAARDGAEALAMIGEEKPDLLILDVMMPHQNGYQVCRRIKTDPALADIPVVFLSAKGGREDRYWGRDCGADDYLAKPFSTAELERVIERLLARREAGGEGPSEPQAALKKREAETLLVLRFDPKALTVFRQKYGEPRFADALASIRQTADIVVREEMGAAPRWITGHRTLRARLPGEPENQRELCDRITGQANLLLRSYYDPLDAGRGYVVVRHPETSDEEHIPLLSVETTLSMQGARKAS